MRLALPQRRALKREVASDLNLNYCQNSICEVLAVTLHIFILHGTNNRK